MAALQDLRIKIIDPNASKFGDTDMEDEVLKN